MLTSMDLLIKLFLILKFFICTQAFSSLIFQPKIHSFSLYLEKSINNSPASAGNFRKADLSGSYVWRLAIKLIKNGYENLDLISRIRFVRDMNYEPPQGRVFVEGDYNGAIRTDEKGFAGRWTLSEDKNNRKDGLWIWGLFEEPKYPYLYFYLDIYNSTILPNGEEKPIFDGASIINDRLDFRFNHIIDANVGTVLSKGEVTYKSEVMVKADPFGIGGMVNIGDTVNVGSVDIRPSFEVSENMTGTK
eukprot:gene8196-11086_t